MAITIVFYRCIKPRSILLKCNLPDVPVNGAWEKISARKLQIKLGGFHFRPNSSESSKVTKNYTAPEALKGEHQLSGDFYSLGVIVFELLLRRLPSLAEGCFLKTP